MLLFVSGTIERLRVYVNIEHPSVGNLYVELYHVDTANWVVLFNYPGYPASPYGCQGQDVSCVFDDTATQAAESMCNATPPAISGKVSPVNPLSAFVGEYATGTWQLWLWDGVPGNTGRLLSWCLEMQ
jgi:hypothetical protein